MKKNKIVKATLCALTPTVMVGAASPLIATAINDELAANSVKTLADNEDKIDLSTLFNGMSIGTVTITPTNSQGFINTVLGLMSQANSQFDTSIVSTKYVFEENPTTTGARLKATDDNSKYYGTASFTYTYAHAKYLLTDFFEIDPITSTYNITTWQAPGTDNKFYPGQGSTLLDVKQYLSTIHKTISSNNVYLNINQLNITGGTFNSGTDTWTVNLSPKDYSSFYVTDPITPLTINFYKQRIQIVDVGGTASDYVVPLASAYAGEYTEIPGGGFDGTTLYNALKPLNNEGAIGDFFNGDHFSNMVWGSMDTSTPTFTIFGDEHYTTITNPTQGITQQHVDLSITVTARTNIATVITGINPQINSYLAFDFAPTIDDIKYAIRLGGGNGSAITVWWDDIEIGTLNSSAGTGTIQIRAKQDHYNSTNYFNFNYDGTVSDWITISYTYTYY